MATARDDVALSSSRQKELRKTQRRPRPSPRPDALSPQTVAAAENPRSTVLRAIDGGVEEDDEEDEEDEQGDGEKDVERELGRRDRRPEEELIDDLIAKRDLTC